MLFVTVGSGVDEYPLREGSTTIGRGRDNDLLLPHPQVSQHHARIDVTADGASITDLGSSNGTFVGGAELAPREPHGLVDGDGIHVGPFVLTYRVTAAPQVPEPAAAVREPTVLLPPAEPARLDVTTPEGLSTHELRGELVRLGRSADNDIVVEAEAVSRHHAELRQVDGRWSITDLGSTNGLTIDGRRVTEHTLGDGDLVRIGRRVVLAFHEAVSAAGAGRAGAARPGEGADGRRVVEIPAAGALTIGRGADAGIRVAHPQVSAAHARVERRDGELVVQDLGSAAGTFVNGQPVDQRALKDGDAVRIGAQRFVVRAGRLEVEDEEGALELEARDLSVTVAKGKRILDHVSLTIKPRQFVAVVGGSGSGKSTLVNALSGFRPATEGTVLVNGVDLYRNAAAYRSDLGYVPQDDIIHRDLPVGRALDYSAQLRMPPDTTAQERADRIREVLAELDLQGCANTPIRRLSGGQRKRVSIAVELLTRPSLFFLDEATSGLDPATESQLMRLLRRLADQGRTVILITHATKNVMLCDAVAVMARGGRLAYFGPPDEALTYFKVDDFDGIYERVEEDTPTTWARRQVAAEAKKGGRRGAPLRGGAPAAPPQQRNVSSWKQFATLTRRYLDTLMCDRQAAALLFLVAPALGLLNFIEWDRDVFDPVTGGANKGVMLCFISVLVTFLVGMITSVREIVKEDAVYRRERMVGLKVLPYIASKVAVGSVFALYSAAVLYGLTFAAIDFPQANGIAPLYIFIPFLLGTFSGLAWGLLVSALASTEERAMLLMILVIVPQIVFSGGMLSMDDMGAPGKVFGSITSTRYNLAALVTATEVREGDCVKPDLSDCRMPGSEGMTTLAEKQALVKQLNEQYGQIFAVRLSVYWGISLGIAVILLVIVALLQKRKDKSLT